MPSEGGEESSRPEAAPTGGEDPIMAKARARARASSGDGEGVVQVEELSCTQKEGMRQGREPP